MENFFYISGIAFVVMHFFVLARGRYYVWMNVQMRGKHERHLSAEEHQYIWKIFFYVMWITAGMCFYQHWSSLILAGLLLIPKTDYITLIMSTSLSLLITSYILLNYFLFHIT